ALPISTGRAVADRRRARTGDPAAGKRQDGGVPPVAADADPAGLLDRRSRRIRPAVLPARYLPAGRCIDPGAEQGADGFLSARDNAGGGTKSPFKKSLAQPIGMTPSDRPSVTRFAASSGSATPNAISSNLTCLQP